MVVELGGEAVLGCKWCKCGVGYKVVMLGGQR